MATQSIQTTVLLSSLTLLTQSFAISGYEWEGGIAQKIQELMGSEGQRIEDTLLYSLGSGKKKIMLIAHMDEVGFFISKKSKDFCQIVPIGDVAASALSGTRLVFEREKKYLISNPIARAETFAALKVTGLPASIQVGDVGTFEKKCRLQKGCMLSPSLDNKVGCVALIETYKMLAKENNDQATVFFCFASREEVGYSGVASAVRAINPDLCIDVDAAYAQPMESVENWCIPKLGKGIAVQLIGADFVVRAENRRMIEDVCLQEGIPFQYEIPEGTNGGTNLSLIMKAGYESLQINIPVADQHTAESKVSLNDISQTIVVLSKVVDRLS